jgi:hypothetical protein
MGISFLFLKIPRDTDTNINTASTKGIAENVHPVSICADEDGWERALGKSQKCSKMHKLQKLRHTSKPEQPEWQGTGEFCRENANQAVQHRQNQYIPQIPPNLAGSERSDENFNQKQGDKSSKVNGAAFHSVSSTT